MTAIYVQLPKYHKPVFLGINDTSIHIRHKKELQSLQPCDIAIFVAHPDDESVVAPGVIPYLQEQGKRVLTVYTTIGDAGWDRLGRYDRYAPEIAKIREKELLKAHTISGTRLDPLVLDYPDGKTEDMEKSIQTDVAYILRKTNPKEVYTFGPEGMSGHPDHITIGKVASRVVHDQFPNIKLFQFAIPKPWAEYLNERSLDGPSVWYYRLQYALPENNIIGIPVKERHLLLTAKILKDAYCSQFTPESAEGHTEAVQTSLPAVRRFNVIV